MKRHFAWPCKESVAKKWGEEVCRKCVKCQGLKAPNFSMKTKLEGTPVPDELGTSVVIDLCNLPRREWEGGVYDCLILAVDRLSGWTLAVPTKRKGGQISAEGVAKAIFPAWAEFFGVPSMVTTDKGTQFTSVWWKTLCSLMGIRRRYAQAGHHQANGRAENQVREFKNWLTRATNGEEGNWVEALPLVRRMYHDTPGLTGQTPYQIVYGRTRLLPGAPYPATRGVADEEWFQ